MLQRIVEQLAQYEVVLRPDRNEAEWWAGAASVLRGPDGVFYLAARMRHGDSPKGERGYETRILKSTDGVHFDVLRRITREDAGVSGFERPALVMDPDSGRFKLYSCTGLERGWGILKYGDAEEPSAFDPATVRPVLTASYPEDDTCHVTGYKDPVLYHDGSEWHLFVIALDRVERIAHFLSDDGESWRPAPKTTVLENTGWHSFYTRPASVLPLSVGYLFVYEGSHVDWHDPNYNIATGLAFTPDLEVFYDLSPEEPLLVSTTPGACHTWRYSHWMRDGGQVRVYFEAACPNGTNELRVAMVETPKFA